MNIDLKALSPKELQALITSANEHMHEAHASHRRSTREEIDALLKKRGLTLDEVYPTRGSKKSRGGSASKSPVAPKYRNPADASQTWSGRGRQPLWFANALKTRGATADSFLITAAPKDAVVKTTKKPAGKAK